MKQNVFSIFLLSIFFVVQGCGYTPRAVFLPSHIKAVYIETFQNKTDQPNLENELRTKLIAAFQNDGNLKIASFEDADAVLKGEIVEYSRQALRYQNDEAVWEYRLGIAVNFEFIDQRKHLAIVKENSFTGDTTFYLSGSSAKSENNARQEALDDLSKRILNRVITLW